MPFFFSIMPTGNAPPATSTPDHNAAAGTSSQAASSGTPTIVRLEGQHDDDDGDDDDDVAPSTDLVVSDLDAGPANAPSSVPSRRGSSASGRGAAAEADETDAKAAKDSKADAEETEETEYDQAADTKASADETATPAVQKTKTSTPTPMPSTKKWGRKPNADESATPATTGKRRARPSGVTSTSAGRGRSSLAATPGRRRGAAAGSSTEPRPAKRKAVDEAAPAEDTPVRKWGRPAKTATPKATPKAVKAVKAGKAGKADKTENTEAKTNKVDTDRKTPTKRGRPKRTDSAAAVPSPTVARTSTRPQRAATTQATNPRGRGAAKLVAAPKTAAEPKTAKPVKATEATKEAKPVGPATGAKRGLKPSKKAESEYIVEAILDERVDRATMVKEYLLKWQGYPKGQSTWEPRTHLKGCKKLLQEYEAKK